MSILKSKAAKALDSIAQENKVLQSVTARRTILNVKGEGGGGGGGVEVPACCIFVLCGSSEKEGSSRRVRLCLMVVGRVGCGGVGGEC